MIEILGKIGTPHERRTYRDPRLERKGFLSIVSFAIDGHRRRFDAMQRTSDAVVVLPVDFARREIYAQREVRPLKAIADGTPGGAWLERVIRTPGSTEVYEASTDLTLIYELPAGMIEKARGRPVETPEEAACRELFEESGLVITPDRLKAYPPYFPSIGGTTERVHAFIADLPPDVERREALGDGGEQIELLKMGWDDAFDLLDRGEWESATSVLLLGKLKILDLERQLAAR